MMLNYYNRYYITLIKNENKMYNIINSNYVFKDLQTNLQTCKKS